MGVRLEFDSLKEQVEDSITLLQKLKDTDSSIEKVNSKLGQLFQRLQENDIVFAGGSIKTVDKLFEELNRTGFMKARKLGLVYAPYKVHFKKHKRKPGIMKAEFAEKRAIPSVSRELRTSGLQQEVTRTAPALSRRDDAKTGVLTAEQHADLVKAINERASKLFAPLEELFRRSLGVELAMPTIRVIPKPDGTVMGDAIAQYHPEIHTVTVVEENLVNTLILFDRNQIRQNLTFSLVLAHELAHALLGKSGVEDQNPKFFAENPYFLKYLKEGSAEILSIYAVLAANRDPVDNTTIAITALKYFSVDLVMNADAMGAYVKHIRENLSSLPHKERVARIELERSTVSEIELLNLSKLDNYSRATLALARELIRTPENGIMDVLAKAFSTPFVMPYLVGLLFEGDTIQRIERRSERRQIITKRVFDEASRKPPAELGLALLPNFFTGIYRDWRDVITNERINTVQVNLLASRVEMVIAEFREIAKQMAEVVVQAEKESTS